MNDLYIWRLFLNKLLTSMSKIETYVINGK